MRHHQGWIVVACIVVYAFATIMGQQDRATQFLCFAILFRTFILEGK